MTTANNESVIAWFDIPSVDFDRAIRFYETVLQTALQREVIGGVPTAVFVHPEAATGGAVVYLNANGPVTAALERAKRAGGIVQGAVIELPNNYGYIGYLIDTEGNRVGLHSLKCS